MRTKLDQLVFITLLIIFSLVGCAWSQGSLKAKIYPCRDETAILVAFKTGVRIELCCAIRYKECNTTTNNDTLSLGLDGRDDNVANTSRLNNCVSKLVIENASAEDQGRYICSKNGISMAIQSVFVVEKPKQPELKKFIVSPQNSITVEFCVAYSVDDKTSVLVKDHLSNRDLKLECDVSQRCHVCKYNESNKLFQKPAARVTVIVQVFRYPHIVETKKNFSVMAHIRPGCMTELNVGNITSTEAVFRFCMEYSTYRLIPHMNLANSSLQLRVKVDRLQGISQRIMVNLPAKCQCMALRLVNLTAFTKYQVSVSGIGGGGEGVASVTNFTSDKTVPANPPHSDKFSYTRTSYEDDQGNSKPAVVLYWEHLPHADQGGSNVKYILKLQDNQWEDVTPHLFQVFTLKSRKKQVSIKIWAENEIGRSENYSQIFIPAEKDFMETPVSYVEFNKEKARVLLKTPPHSQTEIEKLAIHWCQEQRHDSLYNLDVCQDYPKTDVDTLKDEYQIILTDEILYAETTEKTHVQYYYIKNLNDALKTPKTASAITILHPSNSESSGSNLNYRRRRSTMINSAQGKSTSTTRDQLPKHLPSTELPSYSNIAFDPDPIATKPPSGGMTLITESGNRIAKSYPSVFVSFYQNGNWSGMVRTRCNYDRALADVALTMRQNNSGSKVFLQWKQTCDIQPQQFLADFFQVYTSPDIDCTDNAVRLGNILQNQMFSTSEVEVPVNKKFACVRAYRQKSSYDEDFTSKSFVKAISSPEADNSHAESIKIVIAVCSLVASGIIIVILIYCIRENLDKQKYFKNLRDKECLSPPSSLHSSCWPFKESFKPGLPPRQGHSESENPSRPIRTTSTDSGLWTISEKYDDKDEVQANALSKTPSLSLSEDQKLTIGLLQCNGSTPTSSASRDSEMFQKCSMEIEMKDFGNDETEGDRAESNFSDIKSETSKDDEGNEKDRSCVDFEDNNEEELLQREACEKLGFRLDLGAVSSESSYEEQEDYEYGRITNGKNGSNSSSLDTDQNVMSVDKGNVGMSYPDYQSTKQNSDSSSTNINSAEELDSHCGECKDGLELCSGEKSLKDLRFRPNGDSEEEFIHASDYLKLVCAHATFNSKEDLSQCGEC